MYTFGLDLTNCFINEAPGQQSSFEFCFHNHRGCSPSGLLIPFCCFRSPLGQASLKGLLFQLEGLLHCWCTPVHSLIAAYDKHRNLLATTPSSCFCNGGLEHVHMDSMSPSSLGMLEKIFYFFCNHVCWNTLLWGDFFFFAAVPRLANEINWLQAQLAVMYLRVAGPEAGTQQ